MNTHRLNKTVVAAVILAASAGLSGCSDWLEPQSINDTDLNATLKTEEYYASLRKWKETPGLPQVFVWFDNWSGESPTGERSLRGLPDSVTIASNWGGPTWDLTPVHRADMEYVQKVKGTKVVVTLFSQNVGDSVDPDPIYETAGDSSDPEVVRPAIKAYAKAIYDKVMAAGYDGYDWDYEPEGGGSGSGRLWRNKVQRTIFVEELSYWFGKGAMDPSRDRGDRPMPEKRLLFIIDGEVGCRGRMDAEWLSYYVDYFVLQAYGGSGLKGRVTGVIEDMEAWVADGTITPDEIVRRTILAENFESYAGTGGGFLDMADLIYENTWPYDGSSYDIEQMIGGCGIYRVGFDYNQGKGDYNGSPEYYYLRQGITHLYRNYRNTRKHWIFEENPR